MKQIIIIFFIWSNSFVFTQNVSKKQFDFFISNTDSIRDGKEALNKLTSYPFRDKLNAEQKFTYFDKIITIAQNNQEFSKELKYALVAKDLAYKLDRDTLVSYFIMKIGAAYYYLGKREKSLHYFEKANKIALKCHNWSQIAKTSNNIGAIYLEIKKYDIAEKYLNEAVNIYKEKNILYEKGLLPYRLLATLYTDVGKYQEAEKIFIEINEAATLNKDTTLMCYNLVYYANLLEKTHKLKKGIVLANNALKLQDKQKNNLTIILIYRCLAKLYGDDKQYLKAIDTHKKLNVLKAKVFSEDLEKKVAETEVKYKLEKIKYQKQKALENAKSEQKEKEFYILIFVGILIFIVFLAILIYFKQQVKSRKNQIENQKKLIESVVKAQEEEKLRISRDLHDGICQKFALTKLNFSAIKMDDEQEELKFKKAVNLLDESTNELRNISHHIMPPSLQNNDLITALKQIAINTFLPPISLNFEVFGVPFILTEIQEINIYRVVQEIFANIIKHSNATEVSVQLVFSNENLIIFIEDNGIGIPVYKNEGAGLKNINIRAEIIQAKINFEPGVKSGTIFTMSINK